ncbi:hypothetical protein EYF80_059889 [Liparis tanakae]|uniref:Uncharacterized protein n=1 Tax=Liparis tanakae TaxID=230148 RepID=A0A4Z2EMF6_9TELE|nr:hypothetical protein EYF80_059889 [Liparis tanakae]
MTKTNVVIRNDVQRTTDADRDSRDREARLRMCRPLYVCSSYDMEYASSYRRRRSRGGDSQGLIVQRLMGRR